MLSKNDLNAIVQLAEKLQNEISSFVLKGQEVSVYDNALEKKITKLMTFGCPILK